MVNKDADADSEQGDQSCADTKQEEIVIFLFLRFFGRHKVPFKVWTAF